MPSSVLFSSGVPLGLRAVPLDSELGGTPRVVQRALDFQVQHQRQTQWCWAAVTSSVAGYYASSNWTQCRVVNIELEQQKCCADGSTGDCNKPWYLDKALATVGAFSGLTTGPLAQAEVQAEIDAGHPVGVRVGWAGGGGHFVTPKIIPRWAPSERVGRVVVRTTG